MASGDALRVWFPEMLEELERTWSPSVSWEELVRFCGRMTEKRERIREARGIAPPRMRCPGCGTLSRFDIPGVSIRSALFALKKIGAVTDAEQKVLDKSWKKYKAKNRLDGYGRKAERRRATKADASRTQGCC